MRCSALRTIRNAVLLRGEGRSFCSGYDMSGGGDNNNSWRKDALNSR
jgi:enoyl-CoA hydratase/carnithine racemase